MNKKTGFWLTIIIVLIIILWVINFYFSIKHKDTCGNIGDQFGAFNALSSGLALAGLIVSIILQSKELKCQREELQQNRQEMKDQTSVFNKQQETLTIQSFESSFYNQLRLLQNTIENITIIIDRISYPVNDNKRYAYSRDRIKGRETFEYLYLYGSSGDSLKYKLEVEGLQSLTECKEMSQFDHYFKLFYQILFFIDTTEGISSAKKQQYASLLSATLSRYELVFLYYIRSTDQWVDTLKPLMEKYNSLKDLNKGLLVNSYEE